MRLLRSRVLTRSVKSGSMVGGQASMGETGVQGFDRHAATLVYLRASY